MGDVGEALIPDLRADAAWGSFCFLFGVPRLDFVVCEAVLFAQEVDADSTEDYFLAEVCDESRTAVLQQFTEQFSAALLSKRWLRGFPGLLGLNAAGDSIEEASFACSIDATA